ncbi:MAG TPA: hypothetical protein VNO31_26750 [Umezawaea sp.]|nr:hypothetical protein [Umezawaea sp.]
MTTDVSTTASVSADYRHYDKEVVALPASDVELPAGRLKWYEVREATAVVDDRVRAEGHAFLLAEVAAGSLDVARDLGFVIHHLCGESFYFLIVCTWRNNNEMWETVYAKDGHDAPLVRVEVDGHRPVVCVWEMGAVLHEQRAWIRFLRSERDGAAVAAYLADRFTGTV